MNKRFFISSFSIIILLMSALALTMPAFAAWPEGTVQIDAHNIDQEHMPYPCETETPNE